MSSRLLTDEVAKSKKLPGLSPDSLNLFFLLVPHYTVHGKLSGDPYFIKGKVCPRFERFTVPKIEKMLKEISEKTNVKWFQVDGLWYLHCLNYSDHQPGLRKDRSGKDVLPDFSEEILELPDLIELQDNSGSSPVQVPQGSRIEEVGLRIEEVEVDGLAGSKTAHEKNTSIQIIEYLNRVVGSKYRDTNKKTLTLISARLIEGHNLEHFKIVIDKKYAEWKSDPAMCKFLRPETLFGNKFESYLNQPDAQSNNGNKTTDHNMRLLESRMQERDNAERN